MTLYIDLEWTPSLLGFLEDLQRSATGQRGRLYAEDGMVRSLAASSDGLSVSAAVQGSQNRPYLTTLRLEGDHYVGSECSCAVGIDCKHGYALALTLAGGAYRHGSQHLEELKKFLPTPWKMFNFGHLDEVLEGVQELFVTVSAEQAAEHAALGPALAKSPVQPLKPTRLKDLKAKKAIKPGAAVAPPPEPRKPWWERLWEAKNDQARERLLIEAYEKRIGSTRYYRPYEFIHQLLGLRNNAAALVMMEQALEREAAATRKLLRPPEPGYLEFVASEKVRQGYNQYREEQYRIHLREWLEKQPQAAPPAAAEKSQVCTLELNWMLMPTPAGVQQLAFELLITTAKMDRRRRKPQAIKQLAGDLQNGVRVTTPLMREVVEWMAGNYALMNAYAKPEWGDEGIIAVDDALKWVSAWGAREALRWDDGSAVRFDPRPARLAIERDESGEDIWTVAYPPAPGAAEGEAGESEPLTESLAFHDNSALHSDYTGQSYNYGGYGGYNNHRAKAPRHFYVRRGATIHPLDAAGMDLHALGAARQMGTAPVEMMLEKPQGMRLVRRLARGGRVSENGGGLVREVEVQPVVEFKAARNQWISVAVFGRSAEGRVFLRDAIGEWTAAPDGEDARRWREESPFGLSGAALTAIQEDPLALEQPGAEAPGEADPADPAADANGDGEAANGAESPAAPEAPARIELPRMELLAPLEHWLMTLIPPQTNPVNLGQERYVFQWPATPETTAALLRRWTERPQGVTYLGNGDFLKMITPAQRPTIKVEVSPSGVDWLQVSVEMERELSGLNARAIREILAASQDALVRLPDGRFYRREGLEEYERELAAIEDAGLAPGRKGQRLHAFHLAGEAGQKLIELGGRDERWMELAKSVRKLVSRFKGIPEASVAPETAAFLRPYQRLGADFLAWSSRTFGGALLADDMGLGKTLQVLAALTALQNGSKKKKPSLVICPASVARNWEREARRFAPHLKTLVIERGEGRKTLWERFGEYDLVIKNYALTRRDAAVIKKYDWLMVCVDEAQAIKNPQSDIAAVVKSLPAEHRIALTGTPIENRLSDLVSIMEFATPGFVPDLDGGEADTARRLRAWLRPVLLRRMKSEVAPELPERIEERIDCAMTENQRLAYLAEVKRTREMLRGLPGQKVAGAGRIQMLAALTRLRQLCCDPALVQLKDLGSGKVDELMNLLPPVLEGGSKVLVFSQFVRMLHRLQDRMKREGIKTYMLTGQTPSGERQELVDRFEKDEEPSVFLISLKAGGTGLNLISATHVVIFDPWWNPAVEAQAIDRTHRIGQDKTVLAFRLVSEGTIEERIMELQEKKRDLVRDVLEEDAFNRTLSREDFEFLLQ